MELVVACVNAYLIGGLIYLALLVFTRLYGHSWREMFEFSYMLSGNSNPTEKHTVILELIVMPIFVLCWLPLTLTRIKNTFV